MSVLVRGPSKTGVYLHIPKCAGVWFYHAAGVVRGKPFTDADYVHSACGNPFHPLLGDVTTEHDLVFSVVRHPVTWYESWWKFQAGGGWVQHSHGDGWWCVNGTERCGSDDFSTFIRLMLRWEPGFVTRMYEWYVGPPGRVLVNQIGRFENLHEDCARFFRSLGYDTTAADLRKIKPNNVSLKRAGRPVWDPGLRRRVIEAELPTIRRFYAGLDEKGVLA